MSDNLVKDIFRIYNLDYIGKYYFYEEEEFIEVVKDGEYILENLRKSNRFDYNKSTYTFTKFGNISEGITERDITLETFKDNINVKINGCDVHLDLIYKMEVKELEDHLRIATRISEKQDKCSVLLYVNKDDDGKDCIESLKEVKKYQQKLFDEGKH